MYSVVLVDDENWVIESLKARLNWDELGFKIVGQAGNGIEAYELIQKLKPDIAFVDIQMPGINGLDLIKMANEQKFKTKFVVISGYAEFDYAKRAIDYGTIGYCLKPFDEMEIIKILEGVKSVLAQDMPSESEFFEYISKNGTDANLKVADVFKNLDWKWDNGDEIISVVSIGTGILKLKGYSLFSLKLGMQKRLNLIECKNLNILKNTLSAIVDGDISGIGIGGIITKVSEIKTAMEEAEIAVYHSFITSKMGLYDYAQIEQGDINKNIMELEQSIRNKDINSIEILFNKLNAAIGDGVFNIRSAFRFYNSAMAYLHDVVTDKSEDAENYIYSYEQLVNTFSDIKEMFSYLKDISIKHVTGNEFIIQNPIKNETLKSILKYINANYSKDILIQDISKEYFVNPNYLSQLFKKETGKTYSDYICEIRVKHASELLVNTELPINEVGAKSGYTDYFYFNRIFKRITGKTPTQYRIEHHNK